MCLLSVFMRLTIQLFGFTRYSTEDKHPRTRMAWFKVENKLKIFGFAKRNNGKNS